MRIIIAAITIIAISYVIKVDFVEGTIPLAAFSSTQPNCQDVIDNRVIIVKVLQGDTIQSLFAMYPSEVQVSFSDRLTMFYELNPHLVKQPLVGGENIKLPIWKKSTNSCTK